MYHSLGKISFPGEVKALEFVAIDNLVSVSVTSRIVQTQNAEQLIGTQRGDFLQLS